MLKSYCLSFQNYIAFIVLTLWECLTDYILILFLESVSCCEFEYSDLTLGGTLSIVKHCHLIFRDLRSFSESAQR